MVRRPSVAGHEEEDEHRQRAAVPSAEPHHRSIGWSQPRLELAGQVPTPLGCGLAGGAGGDAVGTRPRLTFGESGSGRERSGGGHVPLHQPGPGVTRRSKRMRRVLLLGGLVLTVAVAAAAVRADAGERKPRLVRVVSGLEEPVYALGAPRGARAHLRRRAGRGGFGSSTADGSWRRPSPTSAGL